jgi:integrase/recombinase XerC
MFLERFIQYIKFEKRYSATYRSCLSVRSGSVCSLFKCLTGKDISHPADITHHDIRNWMVSLMDDKLTPRSINRKIATLRKYFKFLLQEGVMEVNPALTHRYPQNSPRIYP